MTESELEKKFKDRVERAGGRAYKFVSPGTSGVPDRMVIFPGGQVGFVEVKAPGKKPRPDQQHQLDQLRKIGCRVFVLDHPDQIPGIIRRIKRQEEEQT